MTEPTFPVLRTARLVLRQARQEDAQDFFLVAQDEDVMRYFGVEPFKSKERALDAISWHHSD